MRWMFILAMAAVAVFRLDAADVAGSWKGTLDTQMGAMEVAITFTSQAPLAGRVQAGEYQGTIEKARLDGNRISFEANIEPGKLVFEGTVDADEMKLAMTGTQGTKYSLVCRRQK